MGTVSMMTISESLADYDSLNQARDIVQARRGCTSLLMSSTHLDAIITWRLGLMH